MTNFDALFLANTLNSLQVSRSIFTIVLSLSDIDLAFFEKVFRRFASTAVSVMRGQRRHWCWVPCRSIDRTWYNSDSVAIGKWLVPTGESKRAKRRSKVLVTVCRILAARIRTLTWGRGHARTLREAATVYKRRVRISESQSTLENARNVRDKLDRCDAPTLCVTDKLSICFCLWQARTTTEGAEREKDVNGLSQKRPRRVRARASACVSFAYIAKHKLQSFGKEACESETCEK